MNSYLKLKLPNNTSAMAITPAGCIDSIFRKLDVYHGSNVLQQSINTVTDVMYCWIVKYIQLIDLINGMY